MTGLMLATVVHASLLASAAETETYAAALREAEKGKPIMVLVSTEWCGPCRKMEKTVLPEVRRRGLLRRVAFAIVNPDRQRKLAQKLTRGNPAVPQLVMYRRTAKGWRRRGLVGGQSTESVVKFINQAIAADEEAEEKQEKREAQEKGKAKNKKDEKTPDESEAQPTARR